MSPESEKWMWYCTGGGILLFAICNSIAILQMPHELRYGVETWRAENAVEMKVLKEDFKKLSSDAKGAKKFCEEAAVAILSDKINAMLDEKQEKINARNKTLSDMQKL